jgi:exosortase C (VPDSG-CTERM-specific)
MNAEIHDPIGIHCPVAQRRQLKLLLIATAFLAICFGWPLLKLVSFAAHSTLFSYIMLIPFISGYLIWSMRQSLNFEGVRPCWPGAIVAWALGAGILAWAWVARQQGWQPETQDYLAVMMLALLCSFWGVCLAVLGVKFLGQILFPLAFLIFAVPLPTSWLENIDMFFQFTSAVAAQGFFKLFHEPIAREGLVLHLSNITLRVAPECSGIHSTIVLVMTSLLASYLFLPKPWTRSLLVLATIPLAILRNGFRIFVLGMLCVHVNPEMINSWVHTRGGPVFFALSLIPFFFLLVFLRKRGSAANSLPKSQPET